jgi:hypothetical protein
MKTMNTSIYSRISDGCCKGSEQARARSRANRTHEPTRRNSALNPQKASSNDLLRSIKQDLIVIR